MGEAATQADAVGKKIDDVIDAASGSSATTPAGGRVRRQATTGIPTFTAPSNCASFQSMVSKMNAQIALKTATGFQTASNIGAALVLVIAEDISCSADDVAALTTVKEEVTAAAAVVAAEIVVQQNVIMVSIEKIIKVNEELIQLGQTAFADPGTTLAPVTAPPLPTQGPTEGPESATTAGGVDGATTAGGVDGATTAGGVDEATTAGGVDGATTAGGPEATTPGAAESSPPMISTGGPSGGASTGATVPAGTGESGTSSPPGTGEVGTTPPEGTEAVGTTPPAGSGAAGPTTQVAEVEATMESSTGGAGLTTPAGTGGVGATTAAGTGGAGPTTKEAAATTVSEGGAKTTLQAGAGATSTMGEGAATTTADPASRGQAAQAAKEEATKEKEEAEATVAAAQETATKAAEVGDKIDKVVAAASGATTPSAGRVRRQETTGIPTFTVPSTCASFQAMVKEMNAQIALKTVTGFATAPNIGTALIDVNPDTISCSASDVAALNAVKAEVTAA